MSEKWDPDDQYLILYVCTHETLKGTTWTKKHTVFDGICHLIKRPSRTKNAFTSYWRRMKVENVNEISLADQGRMLEIVRITGSSLRL